MLIVFFLIFCCLSLIFTSQCYASMIYAVNICLLICLSQVGVLQRWLNVGSRKQRHTIARDCCFLMPKISAKFRRDHSQWGRQIEMGRLKWWFLTNVSLYLRNDARYENSYCGTLTGSPVIFPVTLSDPKYPKPPHFRHFISPFISLYWVEIESSNLVGRLMATSASPRMANRLWKVKWTI